MAASPVLENKKPDIEFINDLSLPNIEQLVVLSHLLLYLVFHFLLLLDMFLLSLVLFVHLLHSFRIDLIKIR